MEIYKLNFENLIENYKSKINTRLSKMYDSGPKSLKNTFDYVVNSNGKRIRPVLTLLTNKACNGNVEDCLAAANSIELLHNFTLVHDDIMDDDRLRRGLETVHKKWDLGTGVLSGDLILSVALDNLTNNYIDKPDVIQVFIKGLVAVCEGQALDKEFETVETVDIKDYLNMIDLKTGYLLGMCADIGSRIANVDIDLSLKLKKYGMLIGRGFQIQDDYLELFSSSNNMGKSLKSDILLDKKTFLMILAKKESPKLIKEALDTSKENFNLSINKIRNIIVNDGIKDYTERTIDRIFKEANSILKEIKFDMSQIKLFTDYISKRKK